MRRLPPLNALRVFEVAARTASYAEAGAELGLIHGGELTLALVLSSLIGLERVIARASATN